MILLLAALLTGAAHAAPPAFPPELVRFDAIEREFRGPLEMKMRDIRQNYRVRETSPGRVEFLNADNTPVLVAVLTQSLSGNTRIEKIRLTRQDGRMVFEETITTEGTGLKLSNPSKRLYFQGGYWYTLGENETSKVVVIRIDQQETYRIVALRSSAESGPVESYQVFFGSAPVFDVLETTSADQTVHMLEFRVQGGFSVTFFGGTWRMTVLAYPRFRVVASRPPGKMIDTHRFYRNEDEVFGFNAFGTQFSDTFYSDSEGNPKLILYGIKEPLDSLVTYDFPETERRKNLTASGRFLDELIVIQSQLDQAKTNPSILAQISTKITLFIAAIQEGTLGITDNRPRE